MYYIYSGVGQISFISENNKFCSELPDLCVAESRLTSLFLASNQQIKPCEEVNLKKFQKF